MAARGKTKFDKGEKKNLRKDRWVLKKRERDKETYREDEEVKRYGERERERETETERQRERQKEREIKK